MKGARDRRARAAGGGHRRCLCRGRRGARVLAAGARHHRLRAPSCRGSARDRPDVIINCAAYNDVDRAEDEPEQALTVNAFAVRVLARAAAESGAALVHYSTDFVFDGTRRGRIRKRMRRIRRACTRSRSCSASGSRSRRRARSCCASRASSAAQRRRARSIASSRRIASGQEAKVFVDRTVSPSYVVDVAAATRALVERGEPGLYHCVGTGYGTWYERRAGDCQGDGEGRRAASSRLRGRCARCAQRVRSLPRSPTTSCAASSRCRRGRMRCAGIWRKIPRAWRSARSSPASPGRTARISPSCCSKRATKSSASSAG